MNITVKHRIFPKKRSTSSYKDDLDYFYKKREHLISRGHPTDRVDKQIELLEDALVIYRLTFPY